MRGTVSLELFTPRSEAGVEELLAPKGRLESFVALGPRFVSVGGGQQPGTLRVLECLRQQHCIHAQLQLPRAEMSEATVVSLIDGALHVGISDVLILGGPPGSLQPAPGGGRFGSTTELVIFLKNRYGSGLRVAVCGYPLGSRGEADDYARDLQELSGQVAAGAETVVCLPTFESRDHAQFVADARRAGIGDGIAVLPGLLPLCAAAEFRRICRALHVALPPQLERDLEAARSADEVRALSETTLVRLMRGLERQDSCVPHVYTLNSAAVLEALAAAGVTPLKHRLG
jgi:5,10-methylenetetrahydrofolate reductase